MTFGRRRPGSPGDSRHARLPQPKPRKGNPRDLFLSFRALEETLEPPCVGSSSLGILLPAADVPPARPLRGAEAPVGPAPPGAGSRSALVVSHHLDGFLRAGVAGLLHPATGRGFTAFRFDRPLGGRPKAASDCRDPRGAFRTLRRVPLVSSRTRITARRCLPVVTVLPGSGRRPKPVHCRPTLRSGGRTPVKPVGETVAAPRGAGGRSRTARGVPAGPGQAPDLRGEPEASPE